MVLVVFFIVQSDWFAVLAVFCEKGRELHLETFYSSRKWLLWISEWSEIKITLFVSIAIKECETTIEYEPFILWRHNSITLEDLKCHFHGKSCENSTQFACTQQTVREILRFKKLVIVHQTFLEQACTMTRDTKRHKVLDQTEEEQEILEGMN